MPTKPKPNFTQMSLRFSHRHLDILKSIAEDRGMASVSEALRFCIEETMRNMTFMKTKAATQRPPGRPSQSESIIDAKSHIIGQLVGAQIIGDTVHYKKHFEYEAGKEVRSSDEAVLLKNLTQEHADTQFTDCLGQTGSEARERILGIIKK